MPGTALRRGAAEILGRPLTGAETARFERYVALLLEWGTKIRLVGRLEGEWIERALLLDSLQFLRVLPATAVRVMDLGSGAGIPGIPLRIVGETRDMTLVEARQRRVSFLRMAVRELGLSDTRVIAERAERLVGEMGGTLDAVVARCAGNVDRSLALAVPFLRPGGIAVVAGPPEETRLGLGEWVTVAGVLGGPARRFAVARR